MSRLISDNYAAWKSECNARFQHLKQNEQAQTEIFSPS